MPRCPNCGRDNPDDARFCAGCATAMGSVAFSELRKTVTVVFADLADSTSLGERLDPETLRRVIARYYEGSRAALEHHGGTVAKFIGDAVMGVFGIPKLHEDDAIRAVRAAAETQRALQELNEELDQRYGVRLHARIGVNTGEVVADDADSGESFSNTALPCRPDSAYCWRATPPSRRRSSPPRRPGRTRAGARRKRRCPSSRRPRPGPGAAAARSPALRPSWLSQAAPRCCRS